MEKAGLTGKFIAVNTYIEKRSQINNLTPDLKKLEKETQIKPNVRRRNEIINIKAEINTLQNRNTIEKNQ